MSIARAALERAAVDRELLSDLAGSGVVGLLENKLAQVCDVRYAVSTPSGTTALTTGLLALGVRPGDEVIVADYGYGGTAAAVLLIGAIPVFVDIRRGTLSLDPDAAARAIGRRTKAIIATHLAGIPADIDGLVQVAEQHSLRLIFDGAQALGAIWHGRPIGAFGDATALSFGRGKSVTSGEGGALLMNEAETFQRAIFLSQHALRGLTFAAERRPAEQGAGLRIHPLAAAIALGELDLLPARVALMQARARIILERCAEIPLLHPYLASTNGEAAFDDQYVRIISRETTKELTSGLSRTGLKLEAAPARALHELSWWPWAQEPRQASPCPISGETQQSARIAYCDEGP